MQFEPLEDRRVLAGLDFGDAPDTTPGTASGDYQSLLADNGPRHALGSPIYLGSPPDAETDSLVSLQPNGDDYFGDDENSLINEASGFVVTVGSEPTVAIRVTNTIGVEAKLYGWIDTNGDGNFDNATERAEQTISGFRDNETVVLTFPTVQEGFTGTTYARFRISTDDAAANPWGAAQDGEVEDYVAEVVMPANASRHCGDCEITGGYNDFLLDDYRFAQGVAAIGDLDGDGFDDLAVGIPGNDVGHRNEGAVKIMFRGEGGNVKDETTIRISDTGLDDGYRDDEFGYSIANLGDLDGDGPSVTALAVGAPFEDVHGVGVNTGAVFILFLDGSGELLDATKIDTDTAGLESLQPNDTFGISVAAIGDVDGDEVTDLAVGSKANGGAVHVLYMRPDGHVDGVSQIGHQTGGFGDVDPEGQFGASLAGISDIDNDFYDTPELVVGEPGSQTFHVLRLASGRPSSLVRDYTSNRESYVGYGLAIASVGDYNFDGIPDLVVASDTSTHSVTLDGSGAGTETWERQFNHSITNPRSLASTGVMNQSGKVEVIAGFPYSRTGILESHPVGAWDGQWMLGINRIGHFGIPTSSFGASIASVGDIDHNGWNEIAIGDPNGQAVHILFMNELNQIIDTKVIGRNLSGVNYSVPASGQFGASVATIGDLNADGITDLIVGAPQAGSGAVFVVFLDSDGTAKDWKRISSNNNGGPLLESGQRFGTEVTTLGDVTGDGFVDVAVAGLYGQVYLMSLNEDGVAQQSQRVIVEQDGEAIPLDSTKIAGVGDVNGDGVPDLAAAVDDAILVLFMDRNGAVVGQSRIEQIPQAPDWWLEDARPLNPQSIAPVGDIDGDGIPDLVIHDDRYIQNDSGETILLTLTREGTAKEALKLGYTYVGNVAAVGDQNGDGFPELAIGIPNYAGNDLTNSYGWMRINSLWATNRGDTGSAPDTGPGTGPSNYQTKWTDDGPVHQNFQTNWSSSGNWVSSTNSPVSMGTVPDSETAFTLKGGEPAVITIPVTNDLETPVTLFGWIDTNLDGLFDEAERAAVEVPAGASQADGDTVTIVFPQIPGGLEGTTYARFRFSTDLRASEPTGTVIDGNVRDYQVTVTSPPAISSKQTIKIDPNPFFGQFGGAVASIGDINGDGVEDFAVGSTQQNRVSVLLMNAAGFDFRRTHLTSDASDSFNSFGGSVAALGDLDGDGPSVAALAVGGFGESSEDVRTGTVHIVFLGADGAATDEVVIGSEINGGPLLSSDDRFGTSVTAIGDLNEDGVVDLAVGAIRDSGGVTRAGAVYVLFMNANGTVKSSTKIGRNIGGGPDLASTDYFGSSVAALGDFNGDLIPDLAVGSSGRDAPKGEHGNEAVERDMGAVYLLNLNRNGTVKSSTRLARDSGAAISAYDQFGFSVAAMGDLDGDGPAVAALAVGAIGDDTGGKDHGAVHFLLLNDDGSILSTSKIADGFNGGPILEKPDNSPAWFGSSLTVLEDRDGNGMRDILVGANNEWAGGAAYILHLTRERPDFGDAPDTGIATDVSVIDIQDSPDGFYKGSIAALEELGDVNGDGISDFGGLAELDDGGLAMSFLHMNAAGEVESVVPMPSPDPDAAVGAGGPVAIGDFNDDDIPDMVLRSTNSLYVVLLDGEGGYLSSTKIASGINGGPVITNSRPEFAQSVESLGDLDGDGNIDLAVSDPAGNFVYTLFLNDSGSVDRYVRNVGPDQGGFGSSLASLGDFNGDGTTDLVVGADRLRDNNVDTGGVYIVLMDKDGSFKQTTKITASSGISLQRNDFFGDAVALLGDMNDDGTPDIAVGASGSDAGGADSGQVYAIMLKPDGSMLSSSVIITGPANLAWGRHLTTLADRDNNGVPELALGTKHVLYLDREVGGPGGPGNYNTLPEDEGPSHDLDYRIYLGAFVDGEPAPTPNPAATGDDESGSGRNDEDGVLDPARLQLTVGATPQVDLRVTNNAGAEARLYGWIDFDQNGEFASDVETEYAWAVVPDGTTGVTVPLTFPSVPEGFSGNTYARFRLSTDAAAAFPTGPATDGEVEDYLIAILDKDYGDAPAPYQTTAASGGPVHTISSDVFLGSGVDGELDAFSDASSEDGDDGLPNSRTDLTLTLGAAPAVNVVVTNRTAGLAKLHGWIDINGNGVFEMSAGEYQWVDVSAAAEQEIATLKFPELQTDHSGQTYARFRLTTDDAAASPVGPYSDGEVEDYEVTIVDRDYGDAPAEYGTPSHRAGKPLRLGSLFDAELTAAPNAAASSDDLIGSGGNDEDGIVDATDLFLNWGEAPVVRVYVTNDTIEDAKLHGWIDYSGADGFQPNEKATAVILPGQAPDGQLLIPAGFTGDVELVFPTVPETTLGTTYARFRLSSDAAAADPTGPANNGEVEDHVVTISESPFAFLSIDDVTEVEGAVGITEFVFTVIRSGNLTGEVSVDYQTSDVTATVADNDYESTSGTLTFADGESQKTITIEVNGDTRSESHEYFSILLSGATENAVLSRSLGTGTIPNLDGFVIRGAAAGDNSGYSVSAAGDLNDDGYDDVIIGASNANPDGKSNAGESYVVFGGDSLPSVLDLGSLDGDNGLVLRGAVAGDQSGISVSAAGDLNNDGIDDVIIGANAADPDGKSFAGESYVVFGGDSLPSFLDLGSLDGTKGFVLRGAAASDHSGYSVSAAGDLNNDEIDDVIIGAWAADPDEKNTAGESYVVFGGDSFPSVLDLGSLDEANGFILKGAAAGDQSGWSVSAAGDMNNDEIDDVIIGAWRADPDGKISAGESYVVFGSESFSSVLDLGSLAGTKGFVLRGAAWGNYSGYSVSAAGDMNNDEIDDVIIGAWAARPNGNNAAGESYVVFGGESFPSVLDLGSLDGGNGFVLRGAAAGDQSGISVSAAGDLNNDGIDDVIIGANAADPDGKSYAGESYVVFGGESFSSFLDLGSLDGANGFVLRGAAVGDESGRSVSATGDLNNDGIDDVIVWGRSGEGYVVYGGATFPSVLELSSLDQSVQSWVDEALAEHEPTLNIDVDVDSLWPTLDEIKQLDDLDFSNGEALEIVLNLKSGTYSGTSINLPAGITVKLVGSGGVYFPGASPALTLESGQLIVDNITFINDTDAPTIRVLDGSLTLRNSVIEETTTASQPAIDVVGGKLDLGTADDPGRNTVIIHGEGDLLHHPGDKVIAAVGNAYKMDATRLHSGFEIQQQIVNQKKDDADSFVSLDVDSVYLTIDEGTHEYDLSAFTTDLAETDLSFTATAATNGSATILADDRTVRFSAFDDGLARFQYNVAAGDQIIASRTLNFSVNNVAPTVNLGTDFTVEEGSTVSFVDAFSDPGSGDTHTFLWQVESSNGQIIPDADTRNLSFTPNMEGVYTISYTVTDDDGESATDTVHVTAENFDPIAVADEATVEEDSSSVAIEVLANDIASSEDDTLSITDVDDSNTIGLVTIDGAVIRYDANGQFESLDVGESALDTFTYSISDGDGGTATAIVTVTVRGQNDAPVILVSGSAGAETDNLDQHFVWQVGDIEDDLDTVAVTVEKDGQPIDSLSGTVAAMGRVDLNDQGVGVFEVTLTATDVHGATTNATRTVTVSDDDVDAPLIEIGGSSGTELEIDDNRFSWSIQDDSELSALSVTVTRDSGNGPEIIYSSTDLSNASGALDFNDYGIGVYEILVVATDGDADWAGDASGSSTGRTAVVGELFVSTSTRARLNVDGDEWVTLHRADMTGTSSGEVLFDHSELSHPWFSWWSPNLDAFHMLADGSMILSTNGRGNVGGQDFRNGGLVQFFGDKWLERNPDNPEGLHQTARMIATEEQLFGARSFWTGIDAISMAPDGDLVISIDNPRSLADGRSYHPGDLIRIRLRHDGSLADSSLYFDHNLLNATGRQVFGHRWADRSINVDGAHVLSDGRILLTVSRTVTVGDDDASFKDGDVFVYNPDDDTASMLWDEDNFRRNEDVDALFLGIGNGELNLLDQLDVDL